MQPTTWEEPRTRAASKTASSREKEGVCVRVVLEGGGETETEKKVCYRIRLILKYLMEFNVLEHI
jgi:hypothetical protein